MKKEIRNTIIITLLSLIIVTVIIISAYNAIMGREGIITKASTVEIEYDKGEVLESLTELVKQKYMAVYNEAKQTSDKKIEDLYNEELGISYLAEKTVLEYYYFSNYNDENKTYTYIADDKKAEDTQKRNDCYWINVNNIEKVKTFGKGNKYDGNGNQNKIDVFLLEKLVENDAIKYVVNYYNLNGEQELVGELEIVNPLIK